MKKIDLGQSISILANVGVIAGIVFLGLELRQNNSLLTGQSLYNQFSIERETRRPFIENNDGFSEFWAKFRNGEPLSQSESIQMTFIRIDIFDSWKYQFREVQAGRLPDDFIDVDKWRFWWGRISLAGIFENERVHLDPEFVQFIEDNIVNP